VVLHALLFVNRFFCQVVFSLRRKPLHFFTNPGLSIQSLVQTQPNFVFFPLIIWYVAIINRNSRNFTFFSLFLQVTIFCCLHLSASSTRFVSFQNFFDFVMKFQYDKYKVAQLFFLLSNSYNSSRTLSTLDSFLPRALHLQAPRSSHSN
jgi:hypothetical protein